MYCTESWCKVAAAFFYCVTNLRNLFTHYYETLNSGGKKNISMAYSFLKVKTVTCRHEAFITNSGRALCEQVSLSFRCWSSIPAVKQGCWRKKFWGEEIEKEELLIEDAECS